MEKEFWSYYNFVAFDLPKVKKYEVDLLYYLRDKKTEYLKQIITKDINTGRMYVFDNLNTASENLNHLEYLRHIEPTDKSLIGLQCQLNYLVDDLITILHYYSHKDLENENIKEIARKHCTVQIYEGIFIDEEQPIYPLIFDSPETLDKVFDSLKGYFPGKEKELLTVLKGDKITAPLYWPSDQKQFTEIFRRLKFNGKLITQSTELKDWLCSNFIFEYKKGATREQRPFNPNTVYDFLTKSSGDLAKKKRIKSFEWIEYISHKQNSTNNN